MSKLHTFDTDYFAWRKRKPRRVKSLQGDTLVAAREAFAALKANITPNNNFAGRLILPEPEATGCTRSSFGRPCKRVDFHSHDEPFGGATGRFLTMGSSPRPRKSVVVDVPTPDPMYRDAKMRDGIVRKLRREGATVNVYTLKRNDKTGKPVTLYAYHKED